MSIMCILRTIIDSRRLKRIHVVGENKLELSAQVAIRPRDDHIGVDETDFVNVQAIIARALCQALAYPFMQPAVLQLLSTAQGSPSVYMSSAGVFVPYGREVTFAQVISLVKRAHPDNVCIGYRVAETSTDSDVPIVKNVLCPGLQATWTFQEGDALLIIARHHPDRKDSTCPASPSEIRGIFVESSEQGQAPVPGCIHSAGGFNGVTPGP